MELIYSLCSKWQWFYVKVIKEKDPFMIYYYTVFASLMMIVLNIWNVGLYSGEMFEVQIFKFDGLKYLFPLIVILVPGIYFSFKNRENVERHINEHASKGETNFLDIFSVGIIILTFVLFFYIVYWMAESAQ